MINYKREQSVKQSVNKILLFVLSFMPTLGDAQATAGSATHGTGVALSIAAITEEYQYPFADLKEITSSTTTPPGVYLAVISIEYKTSDTAAAAIIVNRDNVTIDLNNQILFCNSGVTSTVHGIQVKAGVKNITIKDGTITGFTGDGISIEGTSGNEVLNITLENVTLSANRNGVVGTYVHNATLSNLNIHDSSSTNDTYGVSFSNSQSVSVSDTVSVRNITTTSGKKATGISFNACRASSATNCTCNNNQGHSDATGIYIFDNPIDGYSNEITRCVCNNNVSSNGDAMGIHLETCDLVHVKNCEANNNNALLAGKSSYGLRLESASSITAEGNTAIRNNFGFSDDEGPVGTQTNLFIQNTAYLNVDKSSNVRDYYRSVSSPIGYTEASVDSLDDIASASKKSNISVTIES